MYLLTAIGLPPGGSSTVHIYTHNTHYDKKQTIYRTTQKKQRDNFTRTGYSNELT